MVLNLTEVGSYKANPGDLLFYNIGEHLLLRRLTTDREYEIITGDYEIDSQAVQLENVVDPQLEQFVSKSELLATIQEHRTLESKHVYWNNAIEYSGSKLPTHAGIYIISRSNIEQDLALPSTKRSDLDAIVKITDYVSEFILEFIQRDANTLIYSVAQVLKSEINSVDYNSWSNVLTGQLSTQSQIESKINELDQLRIKYEKLKQKLQSRTVVSLVKSDPNGFNELDIQYETEDKSLSGLIISYGEYKENLGLVLHTIKLKDLTGVSDYYSEIISIRVKNIDPLVINILVRNSAKYKLINVYKTDVL